MNRAEAQSFVEFAPPYMQYLTNAADNGCPTVMAKILGVYRIGFKNSKSGRTLKQDVLVMENLFVGRSGLQVFDLKVRNMQNVQGGHDDGSIICDVEICIVVFSGNTVRHTNDGGSFFSSQSPTIHIALLAACSFVDCS